MNSNGKTVSQAVRQRRREMSLTQAELAERADCKQSAVSMFESGRTSTLGKKTIEKIAGVLELDLSAFMAVSEPGAPEKLALKYCPIDDCPSNVPFVVSGELRFLPNAARAPVDQATRCSFCGEIMQSACSNASCKSPVSRSTCCPECGADYVTSMRGIFGLEAERWADKQRARIREVDELNGINVSDEGESR